MSPRHASFAALAVLIGLSAPALSSNLQFLRDTPISKMTPEDRDLFQKNMREALEQSADGVARRWENPKTGASGVLTPTSTVEQHGTKCRRLEIVNNVQGLTGRSTFNMCRQADGSWASSTPKSK
jgi:surface antigen